MGRILVDEETGENLIHPFLENGPAQINNVETGEPELNLERQIARTKKPPFQLPKNVKESLLPKESTKARKCNNLGELEPVPVGASFGQTNPICLFLPAIIYFRWVLVVLMIVEVVLHVWAHHKNKFLKDAGVYFRSPFHGISSEFCALCQSETCMDRVGKIQQIRMHKFLQQCNYMKRVVT